MAPQVGRKGRIIRGLGAEPKGPSGPPVPPPKSPEPKPRTPAPEFINRAPKRLSTILDMGVLPEDFMSGLKNNHSKTQPGVNGPLLKEPFLEVLHDVLDKPLPVPEKTDQMPCLLSAHNNELLWIPEDTEYTPVHDGTGGPVASKFIVLVDIGVKAPYQAHVTLAPYTNAIGQGWVAVYDKAWKKASSLRSKPQGSFCCDYDQRDLLVFHSPDPHQGNKRVHAFKIGYYSPMALLLGASNYSFEERVSHVLSYITRGKRRR